MKLEPGRYYVRCVFTTDTGELFPYTCVQELTDKWNYLECKRYMLEYIKSAGGTNPGEVRFKQIKDEDE